MSLELMKMLKEQKLPIRSHYFWPLLIPHVKDNNTTGNKAHIVLIGQDQNREF